MKTLLRMTLIAICALFPPATAGAIPFYSVDLASPTLFFFPFLSNSDVFAPGPPGGPPPLAVPAGGMGLLGAPFDELDAITSGGPIGLLHFSVDRFSFGVPVFHSSVFSEAGAGQQAGDVYIAGALPTNVLAFNQDMLSGIPPVPAGIAVPPPIDDLDALDLAGPFPIALSLTGGHPYLGASGFFGCGGDLFAPGLGPPAPLLPFFALGLAACADDVDALHAVFPPGDVYFSLAPGSPSLFPGSPIGACFFAGCSPADVFVAPGAAGFALLFRTAASLGLLPGDNVNALAMSPCLAPLAIDTDGDGVDDGCDNCTLAANPTQFDGDVDGYGNSCDADYNNTGLTTIADFVIFAATFPSALGFPAYRPDVDFNESGAITIGDFAFFRRRFALGAPGPSGLACAGVVPCTH